MHHFRRGHLGRSTTSSESDDSNPKPNDNSKNPKTPAKGNDNQPTHTSKTPAKSPKPNLFLQSIRRFGRKTPKKVRSRSAEAEAEHSTPPNLSPPPKPPTTDVNKVQSRDKSHRTRSTPRARTPPPVVHPLPPAVPPPVEVVRPPSRRPLHNTNHVAPKPVNTPVSPAVVPTKPQPKITPTKKVVSTPKKVAPPPPPPPPHLPLPPPAPPATTKSRPKIEDGKQDDFFDDSEDSEDSKEDDESIKVNQWPKYKIDGLLKKYKSAAKDITDQVQYSVIKIDSEEDVQEFNGKGKQHTNDKKSERARSNIWRRLGVYYKICEVGGYFPPKMTEKDKYVEVKPDSKPLYPQPFGNTQVILSMPGPNTLVGSIDCKPGLAEQECVRIAELIGELSRKGGFNPIHSNSLRELPEMKKGSKEVIVKRYKNVKEMLEDDDTTPSARDKDDRPDKKKLKPGPSMSPMCTSPHSQSPNPSNTRSDAKKD